MKMSEFDGARAGLASFAAGDTSMPFDIMSKITKQSIWFITGCSTGFGRELAKQLLARGNSVVVTARSTQALKEFAGNDKALVLKLDVTNPAEVTAAVQAAEARFGRIDVLVNNAGIGYFAAVEEGEDAEIRRMFDINLFGLAAITRAVLPGMRKRRHGFIVNFSSIGGLRSFPAIGWYNATKFALEGLSEALWQEVEPLGIRVMLVEPSGFRTDWAGRSADESKMQIPDYATTAGAGRSGVRAASGKQAGDPVRAIEAIIKVVEDPNPPHHLLLGNAAYDGAMAKLADLRGDFVKFQAVSRGADFPEIDTRKAAHRNV
jgi:NAD(P)-dependent dehydrogenase (short-subunit alcohol dehydrogenase family)